MRGGSSLTGRRKLTPQIKLQELAWMLRRSRRRPDERDMLTQIEACGELFHTATGAAFADLLSMVIEKPGPSAASAFAVGCVAAITRPREVP